MTNNPVEKLKDVLYEIFSRLEGKECICPHKVTFYLDEYGNAERLMYEIINESGSGHRKDFRKVDFNIQLMNK